jgi:hypothetical protein
MVFVFVFQWQNGIKRLFIGSVKERRAALRTKLPQNSVALFNPFGIEPMM